MMKGKNEITISIKNLI